MPWNELLEKLRQRNWTYKLIQDRLASLDPPVLVGQATLSDLANEKNKNPSWNLGNALQCLFESGETPPVEAKA